MPPRVKPQLNVPGEATVRQIYRIVKGSRLEIPVLLASVGPMRRGEIVAASLDDLDGDTLHVRRAAVYDKNRRQIIKDYPKTMESDRLILLPHSVAELIRERGVTWDYSLEGLSDAFSRMLASNHIEHFRFHDLRHSFVSLAHAAGIPDAYIQERGGWSTAYTMINVYRHTLDDSRMEKQAKVNRIFEDFME